MSRRTAFGLVAAVALLIGLYALAGFVLLPALVERQAPAYAADRLDAKLTIGDTGFNPFLLRFEAHDLRLAQDAQQAPMLTIERLVVDLEWASLWTRTWTVSALHLNGLDVRARIGADGRLDWAGLLRPSEGEAQPPPALRIEHATVQGGRLTVTDLRVPSSAGVVLGNIEIEAFDIATQPREQDSAGRYLLTAALPEDGRLRAQGSIVLQPAPRSAGEMELTGLDVAAVWPLLRASLGLDLAPPAKTLSAKARYEYAASEGTPSLTLAAAELQLTGVALQPSGDAGPLLRLKTITARGGELDLAARQLTFAEVGLNGGELTLAFDKEGRLDWQALGKPAGAPDDANPAQAAETRAPAGTDASAWRARIEALRVEGVALHAIDRSRPIPLALDIASISAQVRVALDFGPGPTQTRLSALNTKLEAPKLAVVDAAEPLLAFETLSLGGGSLDTGERRIGIGEIAARGGRIEIEWSEAGSAGLLQALSSGEPQGQTSPTDTGPPDRAPDLSERKPDAAQTAQADEPADAGAQTAPSAGWRYALDQFRATGVALVLRHSAYEPAIEYTAALNEATLTGIASAADAPMRLDAQLALSGGGGLAAEGSIAQTGASADIALRLDRLPLLPLQPLLARQARLEMRSGVLSARTRLELRRSEAEAFALRATGDATIDAVRIDEAGSTERFLAWRSLKAEGVTLDTAPGRLAIREIELQEPGAKLVIAENRSVNLTQVIRDDVNAAASTADTSAPSAAPFQVAIERIRIQRGVLDYTDLSLVLPFSTQVTALNGSVLGITTARGERARVQAAGQIEPFGSARVNGSLLPFAPKEFLDLRVRMNNVAMPPLSPYTATFAGRKVAEGKLWLDLEYRIKDGQLLGENKIRLDDFRLGERVEAPNALDVPLDLAVALLTDPQGRINVAVPVRGDVGDPEFDVGALVREALGSLLKRVVTAPFRALGSLFGGKEGNEQLAEIEFRVGSDTLAPPQREKLEEVGRALAERPRLQLAVSGTYAPERDTQALRRQAARHALARALGDEPAAGETLGLIAFESERTQRALEKLLVEYAGEEALRELRAAPREPASAASRPEPGSPESGTQSEGVYRAMFQRLAQGFPLPDAAVQRLAARRADAIRDYLIGKAGAPADRVKIGPIQPVEKADGRTVTAKLTLDAAAPPSTAQSAF